MSTSYTGTAAPPPSDGGAASRVDLGYSLGTGGNDPATYYEKCAEATRLYDALLDGCA
jgi:hypothetical protein